MSISPASATLSTGRVLNFLASVRDDTGGGVAWSVLEANGGTIQSDGRYSAPQGPGDFHVVATSVNDPSRTATAVVRVVRAPLTPLVEVEGALVSTGKTGLVARVAPQDGVSFAWSAINGTITSDASSETVTYDAGAVGLLVLTAYAQNQAGDVAPPAVAVQSVIARAAKPVILGPAVVTEQSAGNAVRVSTAEPGVSYVWRVTGSATLSVVPDTPAGTATFDAAGAGTAVLEVAAVNAAGDVTDADPFAIEVKPFGLELVAGIAGGPGDVDGQANAARFSFPAAIAADDTGRLFVAEAAAAWDPAAPTSPVPNDDLRRIDATGAVLRVAGKARTPGNAIGTGAQTRFSRPAGIVVIGSELFVADTANHRVLRIQSDGTSALYAGNGNAIGCMSRNGAATAVPVCSPKAVAKDNQGRLLIGDDGGLARVSAGVLEDLNQLATYQPIALAVLPDDRVLVVDKKKIGVVDAAYTTITDFWQPSTGSADLGGIAVDPAGNVFVTVPSLHHVLRLAPGGTGPTGVLVAGSDSGIAGIDDGPGSSARFTAPSGIAAPSAGELFVSDYGSHAIRHIANALAAPSQTIVTTYAGAPFARLHADGAAGAARFTEPTSIAVGSNGAMIVVDQADHRLRRVASGACSTVAGDGTPGYVDGLAAVSRLSSPEQVVALDDGSFLVSDTANRAVRRLGASLLLGPYVSEPHSSGNYDDGVGLSAFFEAPRALARDAFGTVYASDVQSSTVLRRIGANTETLTQSNALNWGRRQTMGGSVQTLGDVAAIAVDALGNIFVAERLPAARVRVLPSGGTPRTIVGGGALPSASACLDVALGQPRGILLLPNGDLLIADGSLIRRIRSPLDLACTSAIVAGSTETLGLRLGALPGSLRAPSGLALEVGGTLLVTDASENVVLRVRLPP
ncbi:MAG: hypothetical protein IT381_19685 [Deltaproteobacteria bacterium]|nr:hypothetical protein [Deltaproteobacteria bacterium]